MVKVEVEKSKSVVEKVVLELDPDEAARLAGALGALPSAAHSTYHIYQALANALDGANIDYWDHYDFWKQRCV